MSRPAHIAVSHLAEWTSFPIIRFLVKYMGPAHIIRLTTCLVNGPSPSSVLGLSSEWFGTCIKKHMGSGGRTDQASIYRCVILESQVSLSSSTSFPCFYAFRLSTCPSSQISIDECFHYLMISHGPAGPVTS